MIALVLAAAVGAVLALAISRAVRRRRPATSRHRAGPGRPAALPVAPTMKSPAVERATAPILSFGVEQVR